MRDYKTLKKRLKIAILADIHGNPLALDAVLEDIQEQGGVDEYWVLGDLAALGHAPLEVLERLAALPRARFIRGNTDRFLANGEQPGPSLEKILQDPEALALKMRLASSFAWTTGAVAPAGWLPWLRALPLEMRLILPDGTRVLAVHAAPGTDDGDGLRIRSTDDELQSLLAGVEADLVMVGHTHLPFDRQVRGVRVVNPGSVSNPFPPDLRASYALLTCDSLGYTLVHRRADYDHQSVIEALKRLSHPSEAYLTRFMRGENQPPG
jgi:predicted phosphodiesterase